MSSISELCSMIESELSTPTAPDEISADGWMTQEQMREEASRCGQHISQHRMRRIIREGVARGLIEMMKFNLPDVNGNMKPRPFYREVQRD